MTVRKNYYYILGLTRRATEREIKRAYHRLVQQYHPDHDPSVHAQKQFKEVTEAYDVLIDPEARADFDKQMNPQPGAEFNEPMPPPSPPASGKGVHLGLRFSIGRVSFRVRLMDDAPPDADVRRGGETER